MRLPFTLALVILAPAAASAQDAAMVQAVEDRLATARYVLSLRTRDGGFAPAAGQAAPTLRSTAAGVRALKYLTGKPIKECVPDADKAAGFVWGCYDPQTGGFADTFDGKPDVPATAVGVAVAIELGIPRDKIAKAMDYLKANAKTFEEVRIGAAAVEVWGPKDSPIDMGPWFETASGFAKSATGQPAADGGARDLASVAAMALRVGKPLPGGVDAPYLLCGQREDGGWGRKGEKASDVDTTYRVMRALYLMKAKPDRPGELRKFVAARRNNDGGYGLTPGGASSAGGTYYAAIISKWLDELEKK